MTGLESDLEVIASGFDHCDLSLPLSQTHSSLHPLRDEFPGVVRTQEQQCTVQADKTARSTSITRPERIEPATSMMIFSGTPAHMPEAAQFRIGTNAHRARPDLHQKQTHYRSIDVHSVYEFAK